MARMSRKAKRRRVQNTEARFRDAMQDVGTMMGALFQIAKGTDDPKSVADEALRKVGAVELAEHAREGKELGED